jgi:hypothetical protein
MQLPERRALKAGTAPTLAKNLGHDSKSLYCKVF